MEQGTYEYERAPTNPIQARYPNIHRYLLVVVVAGDALGEGFTVLS